MGKCTWKSSSSQRQECDSEHRDDDAVPAPTTGRIYTSYTSSISIPSSSQRGVRQISGAQRINLGLGYVDEEPLCET